MSALPPDEKSRRARQLLLAALLAGLAARFVFAACSWGTSDTLGFSRFAWSIDRQGILNTYRADPEFNHPPAVGYWAWAALWLARGSPFAFAFLFRVPAILADCASTWLLWRIYRDRDGATRALRAAALYAWCPVAMLVSGYHGNTDPIYAFLCLASVYLIEARRKPFAAGLALAAAINVKLIPVLLIFPLALSLRRWRDAARFMVGVSLGALPFVPVLLLAGPSFYHNAMAYRSRLDLWGVNFFLLLGHGQGPIPTAAAIYRDVGRYLLLASVVAWAVAARIVNGAAQLRAGEGQPPLEKSRRWNRYDLAAVTLALFLIFAPGFGVQYTIVLAPLLFAARLRFGVVYGILAGVFIFTAYLVFWDGGFPISSLFNQMFPSIVGAIGLPAWGLVGFYAIFTIYRGSARADLPQAFKAIVHRD